MADKVEITATLEHATITDPAKDTDGKYYLNAKSKSITLKADVGYTFDTDGSFTYQGSYNELTDPVPASKTDTVVFTLPDFDWADQFTAFALTMSAVKATTPTPTTTPTTPVITPTPTKPTTPKTQLDGQLDTLKNSLRVPLDIENDDELLKSYLQSATEYLASALGEEHADRLNSKRAQVVINEIATLLYQNRGENVTAKDFPFSLRALLNQLRF